MSYVLGLLLLCVVVQVSAASAPSSGSVEQLRIFLNQNPYDNNVRRHLIEKHLELHQSAEAHAEFASYKKLDPHLNVDGGNALQMRLDMLDGKFGAAKHLALKLLTVPQLGAEDRYRAHLTLGDLAYVRFTSGDAVSRYKKALSVKPVPEAKHRLARAYLQNKKYGRAQGILSDLIGVGYASDPVRYDYLQSLLEAGQNQAAALRLSQWYSEEPGNPWIVTAHARFLLSLGQDESARMILQQYAEIYQPTTEIDELLRSTQPQRTPTAETVMVLGLRPEMPVNAGVVRGAASAGEVAGKQAMESSLSPRHWQMQAVAGYQMINNRVEGQGFNSLLSPEAGYVAGVAAETDNEGSAYSFVGRARTSWQTYKIPSGLQQNGDRSQAFDIAGGLQTLLAADWQLQMQLNYRSRSGIESATNTYVSGYQMLGVQAGVSKTWQLRFPWSFEVHADLTLPVYFTESTAESGQLRFGYFSSLQALAQYPLREGLAFRAGLGLVRNEIQFNGNGSRGVTDATDSEEGLMIPVSLTWVY